MEIRIRRSPLACALHAFFATSAVLVLSPAATRALDGVREISQASVDAAGGFPFVISQAGSYRLTSNLVLPSALPGVENTTVLLVSVDDVEIDLNGFAILGPTRCTGGPPVSACSPVGSGDGIGAAARRGVSVRNGVVSGMGRDGVRVGRAARIENVHATSNGDDGIEVDDASLVSGCFASRNGDDGIFADAGNRLSANVARGNQGDGLSVGAGSVVEENAVDHSGAAGIRAIDSAIRTNAVRSSEDDGILATDGSAAARNAASDNGADGTGDGINLSTGSSARENAAYDNSGDGIQAGLGSLVGGNVARANTQLGLNLTSTSAVYVGNVLSGNIVGTVSGGTELGINACGGSTTCP